MYDLVGDKIREIFDAQVVDIGIYDRDADLLSFPYTIERGVRVIDEPMRCERAVCRLSSAKVRLHVMETRRPPATPADLQSRKSEESSGEAHCRRSGHRSSSAMRLGVSSHSRISIARRRSQTRTYGCWRHWRVA